MPLKYFVSVFILSALISSNAESQISCNQIKNKIDSINRVYEQSDELSFDVRVTLSSDTVRGYFEVDQQLITYSINRNKYHYRTADNEFLFDDSISLTINHLEQSIFISQTAGNPLQLAVMGSFSDSAIAFLCSKYAYSYTSLPNGVKAVNFQSDSINAVYTKLYVRYHSDNYLLEEVGFDFKDYATPKGNEFDENGLKATDSIPLLNMVMKMKVENYRQINPGVSLSFVSYLKYNHALSIFEGVGRLAGYRVFGSSNISGKAPEETQEMITPSRKFGN
jgi:hypothetical protein